MVTTAMMMIFTGPVLGGFVSVIGSRAKKIRDIAIFLSSLVTLVGFFLLLQHVSNNGAKIKFNFGYLGSSASYAFGTSKYSIIFISVISTLYPISVLYTTSYIKAVAHKFDERFFLFFLHLAIFGGLGIAIADNLFVLILFYELITVSTYPLIISNRTHVSVMAGRSYLMHLLGASMIFLIPATMLLHEKIGILTFTNGGFIRGAKMSQLEINLLFFAFIFGFAKTAMFPFHSWILKAMVAPTPISAILHAVIVVKSGLFAIIMVVNKVFGSDILDQNIYKICGMNIFTIMCFVTILYASIMALQRDNIKERLAYSTISQVSYALVMISFFNQYAMRVAAIQFVVHAIAKITLFFSAGALYITVKRSNISQLSIMWRCAPIISVTVLLSCLAIIGMPPTIGFYAKYNMMLATFADCRYGSAVILIIAFILSIAYVFPLLYQVFFVAQSPDETIKPVKLPVGISMSLIALCILLVTSSSAIENVVTILLE